MERFFFVYKTETDWLGHMSSSEFIIVMTSIDQKTTANKIIKELLSETLAACIQVIPMTSHYLWQDEVCESKELLLMIKSKATHYQAIEDCINALHDYEVPEILSVPVKDGADPYLQWINKVTK
jgi:periplasmic divalent cation tolerance protein